MNSDPRKAKSEPELERDLEMLRESLREPDHNEPPELLDIAVLNAARRAIDRQGKPRQLRWIGALGTATVVVLALTFVIEQSELLPPGAPPSIDSGTLKEQELQEKHFSAERDEAVTPSSGQPAPGKQPAKIERRDDSAARMKQSVSAAAAPAMESEQQAQTSDFAAMAVEEEKKDASAPDAEAWIERLLLLREAGQHEELAGELEAFRRAYPDFPLPAILEE